jgi:hypothetical protein
MLSLVPDCVKWIEEMTFIFLSAHPGAFFVTSDRPVILRRQGRTTIDEGWKWPDVMAYLALSPSCFLMLRHESEARTGVADAPARFVHALNVQTIGHADNEVYTPFQYGEAEEWMKSGVFI